MGRGSRSRAKRNKRMMKKIGILSLAALGACAVLSLLAFAVASDNNASCKDVGIKGGIAGCRRDRRYEYDKIYFVVGNTANTPVPYLSETALKYVRYSSLKKNPDIKIFSVANRELISFKNDADIDEKEESMDTVSRMKKVKADLETAITKEPKTDGAQYFETIVRAGQAIRSDSESNEKTMIIVIGSGLSDGGVLNFADGDLLNRESEEILSLLENKNAIDDEALKGVRILWTGIGFTIEPQAELSSSDSAKVKDIYNATLKASGVAKLEFDDGANQGSRSISTDKKVKITPTSDDCYFCTTREFGSEELGFDGDSYDIRDESKLNQIAMSLESDMKSASGKKITIIGYRARAYCGDNEIISLPGDRANAVKNYIVSHSGIAGDAIEAIDGGIGQYDECATSGYPDAAIQAKNRIVKIKIER